MLKRITYIFLTSTHLFLFSCNQIQQKDTDVVNQTTSKADSSHFEKYVLQETFQQEDTAYNEYLTDILKPVRANFKRINSIEKWTLTNNKSLNESLEGGEAIFYFSSGGLEKIVARHYGETYQQLTEYYLMKGELSFVFEKTYRYNRPFYSDSSSMKENKDDQVFDFDQSEIIEDRSYFDNGKLIHQLNNQDCGSPFAQDYLLEEEKRIKSQFEKLIKA